MRHPIHFMILVLGLRDQRTEWHYFRLDQQKMAAGNHFEKKAMLSQGEPRDALWDH